MIIFIPTRGRVDKQITRNSYYLDKLPYPVIYVVPACEAHLWKDENHLVVPDKFKFSDVRQFILEKPGSHHVVMDDDLSHCERINGKLVTFKNDFQGGFESVKRLFAWIQDSLQAGWIHGGVSAREGNNHVKQNEVTCTREMRFHFYNAQFVRGTGFDFRDVVTKQDFHFTLSMLERGIPNLVTYQYAHNQSGSNKSGGCSSYRTMKVMEQGAKKLAKLHPRFVKVVKKTTKGAWGGGERYDVRINWKKAYVSSHERLNSNAK